MPERWTPEAYQRACMRTVPEWMRTPAGANDLMVNATLGLVGEAGEFTRSPGDEELGDLYWYVAVGSHCMGFTLREWVCPECRDPERTQDQRKTIILQQAAELAEMVKKWRFHGQPLPKKVALSKMLGVLWHAHLILPSAVPVEVAKKNIEKLKARHPDGFSTDYHREVSS